MSETCDISIVMPCLNEAETLAACIAKARKAITENGWSAEIVVADNGSTDASRRIAGELGCRVVEVARKGYGAAISGGVAEARGRFIVMGDADDSYDFSAIKPFIDQLAKGYDLVMGCRLPAGGGRIMPGAMPLKHRILGNPVLSFLGRLFFRSPLNDFHCGLRAFTREAFQRMELRTTGMEFASEMVVKATLARLRVTEVPITLYKDGRNRKPHLRSWRDGWRHLRFLLMYAPAWLFLAPGAAALALGGLFFLLLLNGPLALPGATLDTNTLLVAAMFVLLGFQLVNFYAFTKTFAMTEGLLPEDPRFARLFSFITLEVGVAAGVVVLLLGFGFLISSVFTWGQADFGAMSYPLSLRKVIPGVTGIVLGCQIIFSSFFMSILGLGRKE